MARYRQIKVLQEPFDLGLDSQGRQKYVFNIAVIKTPSDTFAEEMLQRFQDQSVGTRAVNLFWGSNAKIPTTDGPFLNLVETGGTEPERTQNEIFPPAYPRPSAQIVVRAKSTKAARLMSRAAYNAVAGVRNQILLAI